MKWSTDGRASEFSPFHRGDVQHLVSTAVGRPSYKTLSITVKSHFLEGILNVAVAEAALNEELPGQTQPWLLRAPDGDVMAYIRIETHLDGVANTHICAEVSGRHYDQDGIVVALLCRMQSRVGGALQSDS